jgi:hypothetical protein
MSQNNKASVGQIAKFTKMIFERQCITAIDELPMIMDRIASGEYDAGFVQALIEKRMQVSRLVVTYALRPMDELRKEFDWISDLYDGRAWERHSSCKDIDTTDGEREFALVEVPQAFLGRRITDCRDELAVYFANKGDRFAIEVEAIAFAKANPDLQRESYILALGSSALGGVGGRYVTVLGEYDHGRYMRGRWVGHGLHSAGRLLLVHKDA